jgi:hypothetical protein
LFKLVAKRIGSKAVDVDVDVRRVVVALVVAEWKAEEDADVRVDIKYNTFLVF